jgi:hypothetical protein
VTGGGQGSLADEIRKGGEAAAEECDRWSGGVAVDNHGGVLLATRTMKPKIGRLATAYTGRSCIRPLCM